MSRIKPFVALVDDHIVVRNGLAELIRSIGKFEVCREFSDGQELVDALPFEEHSVPDLIIMDFSMPNLDGEQTVSRLRLAGCEVPILMLSLHADNPTILRLYKLGVKGYLQKNCSASALQEAMESILLRGYHQSDVLFKAIMAEEPKPDPFELEREEIKARLTAKELHFLQLVCHEAEYTYEQMAHIIGVSSRTIDGYRDSLFSKFDVKSKTGLVLFALKYRLLSE